MMRRICYREQMPVETGPLQDAGLGVWVASQNPETGPFTVLSFEKPKTQTKVKQTENNTRGSTP